MSGTINLESISQLLQQINARIILMEARLINLDNDLQMLKETVNGPSEAQQRTVNHKG